MTAQTPKPKNDSSDETVIGFKGSEQHHDLKNRVGGDGDADHASNDSETSARIEEAVKASDEDGAVSDALKDAVKK